VAPQPLDELPAADDDPGLRPAEELVAGEADQVGACGQALLRRRLALEMDEHAGAEVVHERQTGARGHPGQLLDRRLLGETDDAEVGLVNAQQHCRLGADRVLVVGRTRAVRRTDLAQPRARARENVRDAEAVADLDQLAARDQHLALFGERAQRQHHGGSVVVDDKRGLRARQPPQDPRDVVLPRASRAGLEVVLEIRVPAPDLERSRQRGFGERRASEVGVDDHASRVQRPPQPRCARARQLAERPLDEVAGLVARRDLFTRAREDLTRRRDDEHRRLTGQPLVPRELVHRGQVAQLHANPV
jgi:hypothetical protein